MVSDSCCQCSYNVPMFKRKQQVDAEGYHATDVHVTAIEPGQLIKLKVDGSDIVLTSLDNQIYAFADSCPHGAASLAKGSMSRHKLSCPDHGYCFDIRSGSIIWPEDELYRLTQCQVKVVDGQIRLRPNGRRAG